jgi:hypothetical protein
MLSLCPCALSQHGSNGISGLLKNIKLFTKKSSDSNAH